VSKTAAPAIIAELGVDMRCFASCMHLASWAGVCPGSRQCGEKRLSGATAKGNVWLRGMQENFREKRGRWPAFAPGSPGASTVQSG
jgi:transposase